jgi:hypothetical protein
LKALLEAKIFFPFRLSGKGKFKEDKIVYKVMKAILQWALYLQDTTHTKNFQDFTLILPQITYLLRCWKSLTSIELAEVCFVFNSSDPH